MDEALTELVRDGHQIWEFTLKEPALAKKLTNTAHSVEEEC